MSTPPIIIKEIIEYSDGVYSKTYFPSSNGQDLKSYSLLSYGSEAYGLWNYNHIENKTPTESTRIFNSYEEFKKVGYCYQLQEIVDEALKIKKVYIGEVTEGKRGYFITIRPSTRYSHESGATLTQKKVRTYEERTGLKKQELANFLADHVGMYNEGYYGDSVFFTSF